MNIEDRRKLRPVVQHIQQDTQNQRLQNQFACVYDDLNEINEPYVRLSMADYRVLCRLSGLVDTLTVQHLPHIKSVKEYVSEEEEREIKEEC